MRYIVLALLLGCGSSYSYPVTIVDADGGLGPNADGGKRGSWSILPFRDGGVPTPDATTPGDEDGGSGALPADAGPSSDGAIAPQLDAAVPTVDAGAALSRETTCARCTADADCATGYSCLWRGPDQYKSCQLHWPAGDPTPPSCIGGSSVTGLQVVTNDGRKTFWGLPYPDSATCVSWLGQWGG